MRKPGVDQVEDSGKAILARIHSRPLCRFVNHCPHQIIGCNRERSFVPQTLKDHETKDHCKAEGAAMAARLRMQCDRRGLPCKKYAALGVSTSTSSRTQSSQSHGPGFREGGCRTNKNRVPAGLCARTQSRGMHVEHWKHHDLPTCCPENPAQLNEPAGPAPRRLRRRPTLVTAS